MESTFGDLPDKTLLTPAEVAAFLRCGRSKIYYMIQFSALDAVKVGGVLRIKRDSVIRIIGNDS